MDQKKYVLTKHGTHFSPNVLTNADDPSDTLALCACGCTGDKEGKCDGSHLKKKEKEEKVGCCGGGSCCEGEDVVKF